MQWDERVTHVIRKYELEYLEFLIRIKAEDSPLARVAFYGMAREEMVERPYRDDRIQEQIMEKLDLLWQHAIDQLLNNS